MKRIITFISVFALLLTSCSPEDGRDGAIIASSSFEIVVDFGEANNYSFVEPYGFEVLPSDVTLVYVLWETSGGQDIWRLMPQTVQFEDGSNLIYNYDFTQVDVNLFLDGTTDFEALGLEWIQNQVFRVVVVPADNVGRVDVSDLDAVMAMYGIEEFVRR
jgi:hypothetical protein